MSPVYSLEAVNERLKASLVRVTIRQRGNKLTMVATLPPKPGSRNTKPHQQTIALNVAASANGFRRAEAEARRLGSLLALKEFSWDLYLTEEKAERSTVRAIVQQFEADYLAKNRIKETTWRNYWLAVFNKLPQDQPLTEDLLLKQILAIDSDRKFRLDTCQKLQKLADFAGLKVDLMQYRGSYSSAKVERDIPSDELIEEWFYKISNPCWQWVYGMIASYGLRDHEVFFTEPHRDGIFVREGKTGERVVFAALYPEWVERWGLNDFKMPDIRITSGDYRHLGMMTGQHFRRSNVPFSPYDLRHAYAIRASVIFRFPIPTSATLMGHSPEVHLRTYQRHITKAHHQETSRRILDAPDRPKPPDAVHRPL